MSTAQALMMVMILALSIGTLITFIDWRRNREEKQHYKKISKADILQGIKKG